MTWAQQPVQGHLKTQISYSTPGDEHIATALGVAKQTDYQLDMRLKTQQSWQTWQFKAHYQLEAVHGDTQRLATRLQRLEAYQPPTHWWDLSQTLEKLESTQVLQRLDRLSLGYTTEHLVIRLGRQALSWGSGQVFNPMDLFNPFAPDAQDTDYKPGTDMLYGQWLFDDGSDLQALTVLRRDPHTHALARQYSSTGLKWRQFQKAVQLDLMCADHYNDQVFGLGLSGSWQQAEWRSNIVPTWHNARFVTSVVANLSYAWPWREKIVTASLEYFHNGWGQNGDDYSLAALSAELSKRLARGELFNTGQDYLATQINIEWTPLLNVTTVMMINLNDQSALFIGQGHYSLTQDLHLDFGIDFGLGPKGTEFGGLKLTPESRYYDEPVPQFFMRLGWFF